MSKLLQTEDGSHTIKSSQFEVTYHSIHGAIQETQTVFLDAALNYKSTNSKSLSILGIGFGTGLNAFMTYLEANKQGLDIHYTAVEAYPISLELAQQLNYPSLLEAQSDSQQFLAMHASENKISVLSPHFTFCKKISLFQDLDYKEAFDIIYFDAFAPSAQPDLWEAPFLSKMYHALKPNGVLTTYCAQGAFKRSLKAVGFAIDALPGPIGKREMTRGIKVN